jgi:hypothetical protein
MRRHRRGRGRSRVAIGSTEWRVRCLSRRPELYEYWKVMTSRVRQPRARPGRLGTPSAPNAAANGGNAAVAADATIVKPDTSRADGAAQRCGEAESDA